MEFFGQQLRQGATLFRRTVNVRRTSAIAYDRFAIGSRQVAVEVAGLELCPDATFLYHRYEFKSYYELNGRKVEEPSDMV